MPRGPGAHPVGRPYASRTLSDAGITAPPINRDLLGAAASAVFLTKRRQFNILANFDLIAARSSDFGRQDDDRASRLT